MTQEEHEQRVRDFYNFNRKVAIMDTIINLIRVIAVVAACIFAYNLFF